MPGGRADENQPGDDGKIEVKAVKESEARQTQDRQKPTGALLVLHTLDIITQPIMMEWTHIL